MNIDDIRKIAMSICAGALLGGLTTAEGVNWSFLPGPLPVIVVVVIGWAIAETRKKKS